MSALSLSLLSSLLMLGCCFSVYKSLSLAFARLEETPLDQGLVSCYHRQPHHFYNLIKHHFEAN